MECLKGKKFLVVRYGNNIISDCIEKHKEVLVKEGYCWFGKIGTIPSEKSIKQVLNSEENYVVLYTKGKVFLCTFVDYTANKPTSAYPNYYDEYLFGS